ncbi:WSC-domain-containing protein, partial [Zopfia rhizophila CBS 207.26]
VEYYGECYFGNSLDSSAQEGTGCDSRCGGNFSQSCGGSGRMNLYKNTVYATENPGIGDFHLKGCYIDNQGSRALDHHFEDWNGMTVAKCVEAAKVFKYVAVDECYYGNTLASLATPSSGCNTPRAGNKAEMCGGSNRLTLYENAAYQPPREVPNFNRWIIRGCHSDSVDARALTTGSAKDDKMTVEKCSLLSEGFRYMGVEYQQECYWGNTINSEATSDGCDAPCSGNFAEICGGGNHITIYE